MLKSYRAFALCLAGLVFPATAFANTEPTAYDSRSVALGLAGVAFLERPSAIAINPALLEGVDKLSFTFLANPIFVKTTTPVSGANSSETTGVTLGPLGAMFLAGRIAPRAVFGAGLYLEVGYGATFDNIKNVDGASSPDEDPDGEDLSVVFFVGEFALATSVRVHDKVSLGVSLRIPFARQTADLFQNIGAASAFLPDELYARVKNTMGGVGFPSARLGISYKPSSKVWLGASWRAYSKLKLTGTNEVSGVQGGLGTVINGSNPVVADWTIPHAVVVGAAFFVKDRKLMLTPEIRVQFHDAKKHGNEAQTTSVDNPIFDDPIVAVAPFNWRTAWSAKLGGEYKTSDKVALRLAYNISNSSIRRQYAQYFTPPPVKLTHAFSAGVGFSWDHFDLDLATFMSYQKEKLPDLTDQTIEVGGQQVGVCSNEQVVRTGCQGTYETRNYWASVTLTYRK